MELLSNYLDELKNQENAAREGFDAATNTWRPHKSVEKGTATIGYGHKLSHEEEEGQFVTLSPSKRSQSFRDTGIPNSVIEDLFQQDVKRHCERAKSLMGGDVEWSKLTSSAKAVLVDFSYTGVDCPKMRKALQERDWAVAARQCNRTFTDKENVKHDMTQRNTFAKGLLKNAEEEAAFIQKFNEDPKNTVYGNLNILGDWESRMNAESHTRKTSVDSTLKDKGTVEEKTNLSAMKQMSMLAETRLQNIQAQQQKIAKDKEIMEQRLKQETEAKQRKKILDEIEVLNQAQQELDHEVECIKAELAELTKEIEALETKIKSFEDEIADLQKQMKTLKEEEHKLEDEAKLLEAAAVAVEALASTWSGPFAAAAKAFARAVASGLRSRAKRCLSEAQKRKELHGRCEQKKTVLEHKKLECDQKLQESTRERETLERNIQEKMNEKAMIARKVVKS
eukprot:PhF_6_TR26533/c0_g1_i1/m.38355